MLFELKGEPANIDNFVKKLGTAVKDEAEVRIPERTTIILLMDIDDSIEQDKTVRCNSKIRWLAEPN